MANEVLKKVWFLWFEGYEDAPFLVKKCWDSWKKHNPDWNLIFLCDRNLEQYIDLDLNDKHLSKYRIIDYLLQNI